MLGPSKAVSAWEISPPPKIRKANPRRKTEAQILTISPYKNELEVSRNKKDALNTKKLVQKNLRGEFGIKTASSGKRKPQAENVSRKKRKLCESSSETDEEVPYEEDSDNDIPAPPLPDTICEVCLEPWKKDKIPTEWIPCLQCEAIWVHLICVKDRLFMCESCVE